MLKTGKLQEHKNMSEGPTQVFRSAFELLFRMYWDVVNRRVEIFKTDEATKYNNYNKHVTGAAAPPDIKGQRFN